MKSLLFSIFVLIVLTVSAFSQTGEQPHPGIAGWIWEKSTDEMTDQVKFLFAEKPASLTGNLSPVMVSAKVGTKWSLLLQVDSDLGETNEIIVTTRWGKDDPRVQTYSSGGLILMVIEPFDINKMLSSASFAVRCEKGTYVYDLNGLKETMKLAGCVP